MPRYKSILILVPQEPPDQWKWVMHKVSKDSHAPETVVGAVCILTLLIHTSAQFGRRCYPPQEKTPSMEAKKPAKKLQLLMAELGFKPWLSASGNVTPNRCKHLVGGGLGTVSSIHISRSSGGRAKWTYDIEINRVMVWGKLPWQVRPGSLLGRELPAEDIWQCLMATNEPQKPGGSWAQEFEERI